ncbi:retrovirus-related pol polyprotein from transposon TNT 1-94 [Tanacetum coccineum]
MACDVSWKSKLSTLNDKIVLLKTQVDSVVQERENIKLEFQKLFNLIKATRSQNQKEVDELIENVNQKTHAYADVRVESSNSVRRPKSKDIKSKNRFLKNIKSSSTYVWKTSSSASIDSNKFKPKDSNVCQTNACVSNSKTVNAYVNVVNDGLNIVCISCGKDVFLYSHEKCVARYALSRNYSVKKALFHSPIAAKSKNLEATSVVAKSRLSEIQLVLWIVDSGCSKHMTDNLQLLRNFVEKFIGTVHFENDHFAAITGYGDYVQGNLTIFHQESFTSTTIGSKHIIQTRTTSYGFVWTDEGASINGKQYILVIVDDYSRYTWVYFLRTKVEAPDMIIDFVSQVQRNLKAQILKIRTDNGTEFKNKKLQAFYAKLGIVHKTSFARTPQQNGVVECRNRTLVEAAQTMLIFSKAPEFLWAEAIATSWFT